MKPRNIIVVDGLGAFNVALSQDGADSFTVTYGMQSTENLNHGQAAREFGECLMHALACDGILDRDCKETLKLSMAK